MAEPIPTWWESRRDPVQLHLEIPITADSNSPKPPKVRKGCMIAFSSVMLRILGVVASVAAIAYGGWTFYQIPKNLSLEPIVECVAQGAFLCFIGLLSLIAELRTRWTMRGCINTYILFANYFARGIIYLALGAIIWALKWYDPPVIKQWMLGAGILVVGGLNIVFYPFYWKYERAVAVYKSNPIAMEPYPEEIIYGMDTLYIKNRMEVPSPAPVVSTGKVFEGANEISPVINEKLEKETPGGPEHIHIIVEPAAPSTITSSTVTSATATTCAEEIRRSTTVSVDNIESIGVGAS